MCQMSDPMLHADLDTPFVPRTLIRDYATNDTNRSRVSETHVGSGFPAPIFTCNTM